MSDLDEDDLQCALFRRTDGKPCRWLDVERVEWNAPGVLGEMFDLPLCSYHRKMVIQCESKGRSEARRDEAEKMRHEQFERENGLIMAEREVVEYADNLGLYERGLCTYVAQRQGWVKIGRTIELKNRLAALRQGHCSMPVGMFHWAPLHLLTVFPGDSEKELHTRWATDRVRGTEWFTPGWDMSVWLDEMEKVTA